MYKIKYLKTGHIFSIPDSDAKDLKEKFPNEYVILEKNGKKFKDKVSQKKITNADCIYDKVAEI